MNVLPIEKRVQILHMLCEGSSMRSISRITDVSINTVSKLLVDTGTACAQYQHETLRDLSCKKIQVDEIWSFCYSKQKNVPEDKQGEFGYGSVWTWTAICADTKLIPTWLVGIREKWCGELFIKDLALRMTERIQLTSDGYKAYEDAVYNAFKNEVDYAMLVKNWSNNPNIILPNPNVDYKPILKRVITGNPIEEDINTSYAERQNLTMRMSMKRFARKTNAFSKKVENHAHMVALYFMYYNFCRVHKTLRVTPAMEAGVTNHVWSLEEVLRLLPT